jgi:hypothetical protein
LLTAADAFLRLSLLVNVLTWPAFKPFRAFAFSPATGMLFAF